MKAGNAEQARVAVVVPAFNAGLRLDSLLAELLTAMPSENILVVDDGSQDGTFERVRAHGIRCERHESNRGKGAALFTGIQAALRSGFAWAITMDADGQHRVVDLQGFLECIPDPRVGVVVGRRAIGGSCMPLHRRFSNATTTALISRLAGQPVHDAQSGFRMYNTRLFSDAAIPMQGRFEWESQFLVLASRLGYRIEQVPVATVYSDQGSHIRLVRDTFRFLSMYWRLAWMR